MERKEMLGRGEKRDGKEKRNRSIGDD